MFVNNKANPLKSDDLSFITAELILAVSIVFLSLKKSISTNE